MTSPTTQGRHDGAEQGNRDGTAAGSSAIEIDTEDVARIAMLVVGHAAKLDAFRMQLMEPGVASVLYRPELAGLATAAKAALEDGTVHLMQVAVDTLKMAVLFETVEAGYYGTGVPALAWKQFVEAQITDPDKPLAFLDKIESPINRKVGPASVKNANDLRNAIESYRSLVKFQDAVATTGINQTLEKALRNGATVSQRMAARRAIAEALGVKPNGHVAGDVVKEFVERGRYGSVDELIARVSVQSGRSVNAGEANEMRAALLAAAPRFGRRAAVVHAALAERSALAAARAAGLIDRVPGVVATRTSVASKVNATMNARLADSTVGGLAKGAAHKAFVAIDVVMIPLDVRNAFVADSFLGKAAAATSAASGLAAVGGAASGASVALSPAAPFLFLGSGALFVTSQALSFADNRNQQMQYETAYTKAYESAYPAALKEALNDRVDDQIQAVNAKFEARRAKLNNTRRATPAAITVQRMAARASHLEEAAGAAA